MKAHKQTVLISPVDAASGENTSPPKKTLRSKTFKDGGIYLFVRGDYKKPTWFCRVSVPGMKGYVQRSTRTTDEHAAYRFADDLWNRTLVKVIVGENPTAQRIKGAIDAYKSHLIPQAGRQSIGHKLLLANRMAPFLASRSFDELDTALISQLFADLAQRSKVGTMSPNTTKRIATDVKHFFRWCVDNGYLSTVPKFPRLASEPSRRPHFDGKDWQRLTRHLREFVKVKNKAVKRDRTMLVNYVLILCNTGIRIGEARTLKWRDVREIRGDADASSNIVLTVTGKTGPREVVARSGDVKKYLKRILDLRVSELSSEGERRADPPTESLVFSHRDGSPIASFKKSFQSLLKSAKVERDTYGQPRTIYSLRHTYATFRLQNGVNHYTLARNMGTSVAMLEKYYGHTSNIASFEELTKQTKRTSSGTTSSLAWLN